MIALWLFLAVSWDCLQFLIVVFPDYTHILFLEPYASREAQASILALSPQNLHYLHTLSMVEDKCSKIPLNPTCYFDGFSNVCLIE